MTALLAFLATAEGKVILGAIGTVLASIFQSHVNAKTNEAIKLIAPDAVGAAEQIFDPKVSNADKKQYAVNVIKKAIPIVAPLIVPGIKAKVDAAIEHQVGKLPPSTADAAKQLVSGISEALNGK